MDINNNLYLRAVVFEKDKPFRDKLISLLRKHNFSTLHVEDCETAFRHIVMLRPTVFFCGVNTENFTCLDVAFFIKNIIKARDCKIISSCEDKKLIGRESNDASDIDYFVHKNNFSELDTIIDQCGLSRLQEA